MGFQLANPDEEIPPPEGYLTLFFDLKPLIDAIAEQGEESAPCNRGRGGAAPDIAATQV